MTKRAAATLAIMGLILGTIIGALMCRMPRGVSEKMPNVPSSPQTPGKKEIKLTPSDNGFSITPYTIHVGKLLEGELRQVKVEIKRPANTGFRIGSIKTNCKCLQFVPRKFIVEPGEKAFVTFNLHTLTMHAEDKKIYFIEITEPKKAMLVGEVCATVKRVPAKLMMKPEAFRFGSIRGEKPKIITIKINNLTMQDVSLQDPTSDHEGVSAIIVGGGRKVIPSGRSIEISAIAHPDKLKLGPIRGTIRVKTSLPEHAVVEIPFEGTRQ